MSDLTLFDLFCNDPGCGCGCHAKPAQDGVVIAERIRRIAEEHDQQPIAMLSYDADFLREVADRIDLESGGSDS